MAYYTCTGHDRSICGAWERLVQYSVAASHPVRTDLYSLRRAVPLPYKPGTAARAFTCDAMKVRDMVFKLRAVV